jgi:hypothetical protein
VNLTTIESPSLGTSEQWVIFARQLVAGRDRAEEKPPGEAVWLSNRPAQAIRKRWKTLPRHRAQQSLAKPGQSFHPYIKRREGVSECGLAKISRSKNAGLAFCTRIWFAGSFGLHLRARIHAERTISEDEFKVSSSIKSQAGSQLAESDDPIESWEQDALGR